MRYVRDVRREEQSELERMTKQEVGRVAMRANMILLSSQGYSVPSIAAIHETTKVTVYKWFDRFDSKGPSGLYDSPRSGRPRKVTKEVKTLYHGEKTGLLWDQLYALDSRLASSLSSRKNVPAFISHYATRYVTQLGLSMATPSMGNSS